MQRAPWLILGLCLLVPGIVSAWQDPLSGSEEAAAVSLALTDTLGSLVAENTEKNTDNKIGIAEQVRRVTQSGEPALFDDNDGKAANRSPAISLDKEILLVELLYQKQKKNAATQTVQPRIAEVFMFDYETGKTSRYEIDLNSNVVLRVQAVASPHLPLNDREQSLAVSLLESDAATFSTISTEYEKYYGQALQDTASVDMKVSVWQPPAANTSTAAGNCRTQRCALISVFTHDNFSFSVEPVVNLMTQSVHVGVIR